MIFQTRVCLPDYEILQWSTITFDKINDEVVLVYDQMVGDFLTRFQGFQDGVTVGRWSVI